MLSLFWNVILFFVGYGLIFVSADGLVDSIRDVAKLYKVPSCLIGLLILGIDGEETVASIAGASKDLGLIAIGNVVGNTIIALSLCFGLPACIYSNNLQIKYSKKKSTNKFPFLIVIFCEFAILASFIFQYNSILKKFNLLICGIVNIITFSFYISYNIAQFIKVLQHQKLEKSNNNSNNETEKIPGNIDDMGIELMEVEDSSDSSSDSSSHILDNDSSDTKDKNGDNNNESKTTGRDSGRIRKQTRKWMNWECCFPYMSKQHTTLTRKSMIIVLSLIFCIVGGELLVYACENILSLTNVLSESYFGYIIVAFVTNIEEITLIIVSHCKGQANIGIAGMIGKTIWNVGLTFGVCANILVSIQYNMMDLVNILYMIFTSVYLLIVVYFQKINRVHGVMLIIAFVLFIFINSQSNFAH